MTEWRLTDEPIPHVSTFDYHKDRERAPHLEQEWHRPRLLQAAEFVRTAARTILADRGTPAAVSDLGCGDGGLLSIVQHAPGVGRSWGYDFQPSNAQGWLARGVNASSMDVFGADWGRVQVGDIAVMTEVLEHIARPHTVVSLLARKTSARYLVCSSPRNEHPGNHSDCHAWAWDMDGYRSLVEYNGWRVAEHVGVGLFQVILAERPQR